MVLCISNYSTYNVFDETTNRASGEWFITENIVSGIIGDIQNHSVDYLYCNMLHWTERQSNSEKREEKAEREYNDFLAVVGTKAT